MRQREPVIKFSSSVYSFVRRQRYGFYRVCVLSGVKCHKNVMCFCQNWLVSSCSKAASCLTGKSGREISVFVMLICILCTLTVYRCVLILQITCQIVVAGLREPLSSTSV